jgi:hypothetical protein
MLLTAILLLAGANSSGDETNVEFLQNRKFSISGFYCDDPICEDYPRRLAHALRFDESANKSLLDHAQHLSESWRILLNCAVRNDRLEACHLASEQGYSSIGAPLALQMAARVVLATAVRKSPRAIVSVDYEAGDCPYWYCSPTPPPPAAKQNSGEKRPFF